MLTLKPGQSLTEENTRAIVRLVQKFYTGLAEKNITVADARGELLFDGTQSGANNGTDRRKLELAMARDKRTELQGALDRTLGPGKSIVMVNVELDDGTEAKRKTEYEAGAVVSTTTNKEELEGKGNVKGGGGAPGAAPNIGANNLPLAGGAAPGTPGYAASTDANGRYNNESGSKVYQPSTTETTTTKGSNTIKKLTVSAMVDQKVQSDQIAAVTSVLRTAIAYDANDPNRSREVTVQQIPFDRSAEEAETKAANAAKSAENTAKMMSVLVPLGLMVLCLFLLARALKKPRMAIGGGQLALPGGGSVAYTIDEKGQVILEPEGSMSGMSGPGSALTGALTEDGDVLGLSGGSGPKTFEVIEEAFDANLESIVHLAKSKPETVAMLIKGWLSEETVG
jgi:flagellar M-ring protein FliF